MSPRPRSADRQIAGSRAGGPWPDGPEPSPHPLDNPARSALTGPQAHFAERHGRLLRYQPEVSVWVALPGTGEGPTAEDWADAAALAGPGAIIGLAGYDGPVPDGWEVTFRTAGVQLVDAGVAAAPDEEAVRLGPSDVPEMLDLVERTQPGPFMSRTVEMGTYLGIRRSGALVAMAGERMRPPGWSEISAVCTDPDFRGQGLAARLVLAVSHHIRARGETPFLHAAASNTNAIRLYESLGFRLRRKTTFLALRVPETPEEGDRRPSAGQAG